MKGSENVRITQNTLPYPKDEVREILNFAAKGIDTTNVGVALKKTTSAYSGRAYLTQRRVILRMNPTYAYPIYNNHYPNRKTCPYFHLYTWQETLVHLAAHEFRHLHQRKHGKPVNERDCEEYGVKRVEAWRKLHPVQKLQPVRGSGKIPVSAWKTARVPNESLN